MDHRRPGRCDLLQPVAVPAEQRVATGDAGEPQHRADISGVRPAVPQEDHPLAASARAVADRLACAVYRVLRPRVLDGPGGAGRHRLGCGRVPAQDRQGQRGGVHEAGAGGLEGQVDRRVDRRWLRCPRRFHHRHKGRQGGRPLLGPDRQDGRRWHLAHIVPVAGREAGEERVGRRELAAGHREKGEDVAQQRRVGPDGVPDR
mmetsp:Transcript_81351/g.228144  ORF Transcript_81351/g.228144 Transcript_81351/m.228144 type:complete len:203 (+) Transcript_81351:2080-2688(+)